MRPTLTARLGFALAFLTFFSPLFGNSNGIILDQDNLPDVLHQIELFYGDEIQIDIDDVKFFLENFIQGTMDPELGIPEPTLQFQDDSKMDYAWPAIPNANYYNVGYLNLDFGNNAVTEETPSSTSFVVPNDLFLFAFNTESEFGKSKSYIIIEDKILAFSQGLENCECRAISETHEIIKSGPFDAILVDYPSGPFEKLYRVDLAYQNTSYDIEASFSVGIVRGNTGLITVIITWEFSEDPLCLTNIDFDNSNIWAEDTTPAYPYFSNGPRVLKMMFAGNSMKLHSIYDDYNNVTINVTECNRNWEDSDQGGDDDYLNEDIKYHEPRLASTSVKTRIVNNLYPNPTTGQMLLDFNQSNQTAKVSIYNAVWQLVQNIELNDLKSGEEVNLDLEGFPAGQYFLQIEADQAIETHKVIKM